ncbi:hypothetical protein CQZ94_18395 [Bacillus sp. MYb209]|nr:hypothetical protein CQZ94_18395 [Bacillus sp. MYb209]
MDVNTLIRVASEQADLFPKILLACTVIGTALTFLYLMTLNKNQVKEQKNAKSLLAMYIVVVIMTLYSTDITTFIKGFI